MSTILVIEDNATNMKLVRDLLTRADYEVLEATHADAGMALALEAEPDLILMDIDLPGTDGLAATRMLRRLPETATTPIVALTAHAMQGDEQKAIDAGCDAYLSKPLRYRELLATLSMLLGGEP